MAVNGDNRPRIINGGDNGHTFVFAQEEQPSTMLWRAPDSWLLWQIGPSICASLFCIPFGMMLGWPSSTYVLLLSENSPLPITMLESPMIAALLMYGNTAGIPFSNIRLLPAKYSMIIAIVFMAIGWTIVWQATNVAYLYGGRFAVGIGNGFGIGQVKIYVKEMCDENIGPLLAKGVTVYMALGVVLSFVIGPHVEFRSLGLAGLIVTVVIFFVCVFLPATPAHHVRCKNVEGARKVFERTRPTINAEDEIAKLQKDKVNDDISIPRLFMTVGLWWKIIVMTFVVIVQQLCGGPGTIVYCQFMFKEMHVPHYEYCALAYGLVYLVCTYVGLYVTSKFNKKYLLLFSCFCSVVLLVANTLVIYFEVNDKHWGYTSLVLMLPYIAVHTIGLGIVPFTLADYLFPKNARTSAFQVFFMEYSLAAVLITKLFQVFYSGYPFWSLFCFFSSIAGFGCFFILLFVPKTSPNSQVDVLQVASS